MVYTMINHYQPIKYYSSLFPDLPCLSCILPPPALRAPRVLLVSGNALPISAPS